MKTINILVVLIFSVLVTGCSTAPIAMDYAPASTMKVAGNLNVGSFKYLPSETNKDIQPNQIRNTATGAVLLDKNINSYFETALASESVFVGIQLNNSANLVSGEIIEFLIDDLGFSVDWTLHVNYRVSKVNNSTCYQQDYEIKTNASKFFNSFATLNEVIKLNIEKVFADPLFLSCIAK